jgi:serine/threonine-protein kinase HipA
MPAVLDLLKASDDPDTDRRLFLKAQIMFWLLGATDGHAKNFSIFLQPGGRFRLTPLYDVMSVQPAFDARQLRKNQMKFALAVGDNRHYLVYEIMPRHFMETAAKSGVPSAFVQSIFDELVGSADGVINQVMNDLPAGFPQKLAESIISGLRARLRLIDATSSRTAR